MTERAVGESVLGVVSSDDKTRELPVGSELMIAFALGAGGWYALLRLFEWVTG